MRLFITLFTNIVHPFFKCMPKAYTAVDWSMHHFEVHFKMKLTYRTPICDDEDEFQEPDADITGSSENLEKESHGKTQWDDDSPWSKWYSAEDPVKGERLLLINSINLLWLQGQWWSYTLFTDCMGMIL